MPIASFDVDQVNDKAYELWKADLEYGNYDESNFEDWVLDIKEINEDDFNLDYDGVVEEYLDEYIEIKLHDDIPDKYIELAAEYFSDEAGENGYRARFTD